MLDLGGGTLCWQAGRGRHHPVNLEGQESTDPMEAIRPRCPRAQSPLFVVLVGNRNNAIVTRPRQDLGAYNIWILEMPMNTGYG